jgi:hypothetical protein
MSKIKITKSELKRFIPIKIDIELIIESQDELDGIKKEFSSGHFFSDLNTEYSVILYKLNEELRKKILYSSDRSV